MIKNKKYKIGFDIWGLIIFIVIMIPNFIWFAVPAPNDILILSILVYTLFSRMFDLMQPPVVKHSIAVA